MKIENIDPKKIEPGQIWTELTPAQVKRIEAFKAVLGDLDPTTDEKAIQNFHQGIFPEREIAVFERVTRTLTKLMESREPGKREDVYKVLMACTFCGLDSAAVQRITTLPAKLVDSILNEIKEKNHQ